jgi:hypothetical protein
MTEGEIWWTERNDWSMEMESRRLKGLGTCSFWAWKSILDSTFVRVDDPYRDTIAAVVDDPEVSPQRRGLAMLWLDATSR